MSDDPQAVTVKDIHDALIPDPWKLTVTPVMGEVKEEAGEVDMVNHPPHYTGHPSGVECIQITEHMNFNLGNAFKYIWRADLKHDNALVDLEKAKFYLDREIQRRSKLG